jgi:CII-binding regulator of phage lambda lysogenization HflD
MPMIAFRIDDELFEQINQIKGDKSASVYCKNVIVEHLKTGVNNVSNTVNNVNNFAVSGVNSADYLRQIESLQGELTHKYEVNKILGDRVKDLHDQIKDLQTQNGFLISEFQRINKINEQLLLPAAESTKKWWQLWKK